MRILSLFEKSLTKGHNFRYSTSSRKIVALFINIGEREKQKLLQQSRCNRAIATMTLQQTHCKVTSFFLIFNSPLLVSRDNSI